MKYVGAFEAKTHFSQLLEEVKQNQEPIILQKRGKNIAFLEPYQEKADELIRNRAEKVRNTFREIRMSQSPPQEGQSSLEDLREQGRER